jgi:monooxygenase
LPDSVTYKGLMLAGVPNLAFSIGYTNASWTLKCDLTCDWVCRLLNHMDERGYVQCVPEFGDAEVVPEPMIDFSSGYVQRSIHLFPKQGAKVPWRLHQNYPRDVRMLRYGAIEDDALRFSGARRAADAPDPVAA